MVGFIMFIMHSFQAEIANSSLKRQKKSSNWLIIQKKNSLISHILFGLNMLKVIWAALSII